MCLILFAYRQHSQYPLILAANRDEFYSRPTRPIGWWRERPTLLAGQDLQGGGTWLGLTRSGRFAAITNIREPQREHPPQRRSRGLLPLRWLTTNLSDGAMLDELQQTRDLFAGYNLLFGSSERLWHASNRVAEPRQIDPGVYGLSNAGLDTPWPKVTRGKQKLEALLNTPRLAPTQLLQLLDDPELASDEHLPDTGVGLDWERRLSAIRITSPEYGTRSSTILLVDRHGYVNLTEKTLAPDPAPPIDIDFKQQS